MNEKKRRELSTLDQFLGVLNQEKGRNFKLKVHRDKPDFEIQDNSVGEVLGIEVTDLFYDEDDAKMLLGRSKKNMSNDQFSDELMEKLSERIKQKEEDAKGYSYNGSISLLIRVTSPIWGKSTFEMFEYDIQIPNTIYQEIWLVFSNSSEGDCLKLK